MGQRLGGLLPSQKTQENALHDIIAPFHNKKCSGSRRCHKFGINSIAVESSDNKTIGGKSPIQMKYSRSFFPRMSAKPMGLILNLMVFLLFAAGISHGVQGMVTDAGLAKVLSTANTADGNRTGKEDAEFRAAAKRLQIATRSTTAFKNLYNGYYLIAGVFGNSDNAGKFVKSLHAKGIEAKNAKHPENNLHYIYLAYTENWKEAISLTARSLNGAYKDKLWILDVTECMVHEAPGKKVAVEKTVHKEPLIDKGFKEAAARYGIATRTSSQFKSRMPGYYIIAGVFGSQSNALTYSSRIATRGLAPEILHNLETRRNLVSLGYYTDWEDAIQNSITGLNGRYRDKVWILEVTGLSATKRPLNNNTSDRPEVVTRAQQGPDIIQVNPVYLASGRKSEIKDPPEITKLLEKADAYFHKMWYSEAADLYETVLEKSENPSAEIIQKAGDAHYFNTNMERAYYWYNRLYDLYKSDMSAENLFKYAHTLKGTGRYGRAKRLLRLYNKKLEKPGGNLPQADPTAVPSEVVLDNILQKEQLFEIKNLAINSKYSEFAPMFHNTDQVVFASSADSAFFHTRRYKWNNQPYLDLYVAKINEESQEVRDAVKFSKKVNTKYHEAAVTFSPDNKTMYFTRNNYDKKLKRDKKGVNNLKIYKSEKIDGDWTEAVELPFNSDEYSTGHPALSPDGKQLYFVSDMPGSLGETDIFVVDVLGGDTYSEPRNLGPEINTVHKEMFPFINNKKLYFSSDGHIGLGGLDIYEVAFDDAAGFLEVRNLGKPINSNMDDFSYIVNEDTQKGYFASNRKGGKGDDDIYSFHRLFPEETNENAIAGVITDLVTGDIIPEAMVTLLDENNIKLKEMVTGDDGAFVFEDLEGSTKYAIKVSRPEYFKSEQQVTTLENEKVALDVALKRLDERIVVEAGISKLKTDMIYFDFDKSYIRKDAAVELDQLIEVMNEYKDMVIRIESHTDSRGPAAYNKYLSDQRAKATRAYLINNGISPTRIESAVGYGEEHLLNGCDGSIRCSSKQHQLNRRSEFIIVSM